MAITRKGYGTPHDFSCCPVELIHATTRSLPFAMASAEGYGHGGALIHTVNKVVAGGHSFIKAGSHNVNNLKRLLFVGTLKGFTLVGCHPTSGRT